MRDRLGLELQLHEAGEDIRALNNLASPVQEIRDSLLQMPEEGRAERLTQVPRALAGYRESLTLAASKSMVAAARQITQLQQQLNHLVTGDALDELGAASDVAAAKRACAELSEWLRDWLAPRATTTDAVGRDRYELLSQEFVGAKVDLDEAYEWGAGAASRNH